jgi:hypothetical protein
MIAAKHSLPTIEDRGQQLMEYLESAEQPHQDMKAALACPGLPSVKRSAIKLGWDWDTYCTVHTSFYKQWEVSYTVSPNGLMIVRAMEKTAAAMDTHLPGLALKEGSFQEQVKYLDGAGAAMLQSFQVSQGTQEVPDYEVEMDWSDGGQDSGMFNAEDVPDVQQYGKGNFFASSAYSSASIFSVASRSTTLCSSTLSSPAPAFGSSMSSGFGTSASSASSFGTSMASQSSTGALGGSWTGGITGINTMSSPRITKASTSSDATLHVAVTPSVSFQGLGFLPSRVLHSVETTVTAPVTSTPAAPEKATTTVPASSSGEPKEALDTPQTTPTPAIQAITPTVAAPASTSDEPRDTKRARVAPAAASTAVTAAPAPAAIPPTTPSISPKDADKNDVTNGRGSFDATLIVDKTTLFAFFQNKHFKKALKEENTILNNRLDKGSLIQDKHVALFERSCGWVISHPDCTEDLDLEDDMTDWMDKIGTLLARFEGMKWDPKASLATSLKVKMKVALGCMKGEDPVVEEGDVL